MPSWQGGVHPISSLDRYTAADAQAARRDFQQAVELDPNYADAWAELSYSFEQLSEVATFPLEDAQPRIRAAAENALALDRHNVRAVLDLGIADANDHHFAEAKAEYARAVELDPSSASAHEDYGLTLPPGQGLAQFRETARLDPDNVLNQLDLVYEYQDLADWAGAVAAARAVIKASPSGIDGPFYLAFAYTQMKRGPDAVKAFDLARPRLRWTGKWWTPGG